MKTNKIFLSAITGATMLLLATSCSKEFYTKANVNPNQPSVVPPSTLLPGVELSLAYCQGGDASRYAQLFVQQGYGAAREAAAFYAYEFGGTNLPDQLWNNLYVNDMNNVNALMTLASSGGYNAYAGIANILMAYSLQVTVDFWGDVPYSQAFQGSSNIAPAYDKDVTLYSNILSLCATGIADMKNASPGALKPGTDDVMYGGNAQSWIAFAYAIEARIYIHQTKHNNATMCQNAINAADSALANNFADAQVVFTQGAPNSSPVYQYNVAWNDIHYVTYVGNGGSNNTLYDTMTALADPRIPVYFEFNDSGSGGPGMDPTTYYGKPTSPVEFITKEELDFILAEATLRMGGTVAAASTFYGNAITDNFTKLGIAAAAPAYITANPLPATNANAQYTLAKQEWIALFLNPEEWVTWRRTNSPALQSTVAGDQIPRRMVLPNDEITLNSNAPQGETLWTPVIFWDN